MSDIRFNQWLHQSGTGGVSQSDGGHVGIGTTNPLVPVGAGNTHILNVGVVTCNNISAGSSITAGTFYGSGANLTGVLSNIVEDTSPQLGGTLDTNNQDITFNGAQNVSWDSSAADFIFNDYAKLNLGTDKDFRMYQDTNNTILQSSNTAGGVYLQGALLQIGSETGEAGVKFVKDGAVELHHDNVKALSTSSTGINVWGRSGNGILDIYPTGSAVYSILNLHNTAGGTAYNAQLIATSGQSVYLGSGNTGDVVLRTGNSQNKVVGRHNGATELYHSSTKKFETESNGASVDGRLRVRDSGDVSFTISDTSSNAVTGFMEVKTAGRLEYNCYKSGVGTKYPHVFMGYTEEYARIDTNGIKFNGDTAAANALDDYEEGSFTPFIRTANNTTEPSYSHRVGLYTKVGRLVTYAIRITTSGELSTGSGGTQIHGLPFNAMNWNIGDWPGGAEIAYYSNLRGNYGTNPRLLGPYNNNTFIRFHLHNAQTDTGNNLYNHVFTSNTVMIIYGQYFAA